MPNHLPIGIKRSKFFSPTVSNDGVLHAVALKGGFQSHASISERNAIPLLVNSNAVTYTGFTTSDDPYSSGRRRVGMLIYVLSTDKFYILKPVGFFGNGGSLGVAAWLALPEYERAVRMDPTGSYTITPANPSNGFTPQLANAASVGIAADVNSCWVETTFAADAVTDAATAATATAAVQTNVNANETASNTANTTLQNNINTLTSNIASNDTDTAANTTNITTNTNDIATNVADIATNVTDIATNATNITSNDTDIAANVTDIAANTTNITTNTNDIATNVADIATNATNIASNDIDIAANTTNITTNTTDIATNVTDIATNATTAATATAAVQTNVNANETASNTANTTLQNNINSLSTTTNAAIALKENAANKSTSIETDAASDVKFPTVKSVKTYVDAEITTSNGAIGTTLATLQADVDQNESDSDAAETTLQNNINTLTLNVATTGDYDIYVDADFAGVSSGSILRPYNSVADAITNSVADDRIFVKGINIIASEIVLPHALYFYGAELSEIKYTSYNASNGDIFSYSGDNTKSFSFKNIIFKNAGGYGLYIQKTAKLVIENCTFENNGWDGTGLNTILAEAGGVLGYDSSSVDLQAFYAGSKASNGGATRIEEATQLLVIGNTFKNNLRGLRVSDCGINGGGFITRNQSSQNIESGIYLSVGSLGGCQNMTVTMNVSQYNANNGLLVIGGINNKFSQNEVSGNWNAGFCAWCAANVTLRDSGLYDNNRSQFNGIGNVGDAKASIQINEAYNLLGTSISLNSNFRFIAEILDTQVYYTGLGSNTEKIGLLITSAVGQLTDNDKNIIKVDNVGFIGQDYAIDLSEVNVTNLRLSLGDNSYQSIALGAVKSPLAGNYSELPFSNHVMEVPSIDIILDTLKKSVALKEYTTGNVINVYNVNELQSIINGSKVDIIQKNSNKIQLRGLTLGNVYVNGVVAGSNLATMNDTINSAFAMDLVQYKSFLESEVGIDANGDIPSGLTAAFYYIESPDGEFHYPLFKAEADANLVDTTEGGSGSSHMHTYTDDLTNTTWYMPATNATMSGASAPLNGLWSNHESVVWNIQTTDVDSNYIPTLTNVTYNVQEVSALNIQYKPAGDTNTYTLSNNPYSANGYAIIGTTEDISNGYGQSISHTINVTKANAFGSVAGTITVNVLADLAGDEFTLVNNGGAIKFTQDGGATVLDFDNVSFSAGSTYKFYLDGDTIQTNDFVNLVDINGDGIIGNDGLTQIGAGAGYAGTYFQYVIPSDVEPGKSIKFTDGATSTDYTNVPLIITGSTWTAPVITVTNEGPATVSGASLVSADNWYSLGETLSAGQRLIIPTSFFQDMWDAMPDYNNVLCIGLKDGSWVNTKDGNDTSSPIPSQGLVYDLMIRMQKKSFGNGGEVRILSNYHTQGAAISWAYPQTPSSANVAGIIEIIGNGNNVRMGITSDISVDNPTSTIYSDWSTNKGETGNQAFGITEKDVMFFWARQTSGGQFDHADVDFTALTEVTMPVGTPSYGSTTNFAKAFSVVGNTTYLYQTDPSTNQTPIAHGQNSTEVDMIPAAGYTSASDNSYPWMMGGIYYLDPAHSAQMFSFAQTELILNTRILLGYETSGTATRNPLTFYWGTSNANDTPLNGIQFDMDMPDAGWYSFYIDSNGVRLNETSVAEAAAMLRFKQVDLLTGAVSTLTGTWTQHGTGRTSLQSQSMRIRMGRPSGVNNAKADQAFKIANWATSTLKVNDALPTDAEIELFINDPNKWRTDYMVGTQQRFPHHSTGNGLYAYDSYQAYMSQHWSFGDHQLSTSIGAVHETFPALENGFHAVGPNVGKASITNGTASDSINVTIPGLS